MYYVIINSIIIFISLFLIFMETNQLSERQILIDLFFKHGPLVKDELHSNQVMLPHLILNAQMPLLPIPYPFCPNPSDTSVANAASLVENPLNTRAHVPTACPHADKQHYAKVQS
jgi:hypothetical protein